MGSTFLLRHCTLLIPLAKTQSHSLKQTTFASIKPSLCPAAAPLLITCFYSVATFTQFSSTSNASVKFFSNIESVSDSTNLTFSKLKSKMSAMMSPNQGTAPLNQNFALSTTVSYPLQGNFLFSFVGIVNFYHCYTPYFEILLKPLQAFLKQYYLKNASYGMDPTNYHAVF